MGKGQAHTTPFSNDAVPRWRLQSCFCWPALISMLMYSYVLGIVFSHNDRIPFYFTRVLISPLPRFPPTLALGTHLILIRCRGLAVNRSLELHSHLVVVVLPQ